ncbi:metallophosphoesterase [Nocardioides humi]|uniref:Calcineurin-like phosphoesterase domain-containing protein n=1 Tax=Nocardioides humi TaxID=449461 RepID=A0ABN2AWY9_9ACTN|nr:metallophosphoesterase [Nocardioides humi]
MIALVRTMPTRRLLEVLAYVGAWLVVSVAVAAAIFVNSERTVEIASHEATLSPDFSGEVVARMGPVLPDLRMPSGSRIGIEVELGKTDAATLEELTARYAAIASQPEGQIAVAERAVTAMALAALVQGAVLGAVPLLVWAAIGQARRRELYAGLRTRGGIAVSGLAIVLVVALVVPFGWGRTDRPAERWTSLRDFVGPDVTLPDEVADVEVMTDATTAQSRRLVESAVSGYQQSLAFYSEAAEDAAFLDLREPEEGETVVLMVSDRHDNIGMDKVARAIADAGGATAVIDAGDDTSTGSRWEAFSLDSLAAVFQDFDGRWAVAGNHDNGTFVRSHLEDLGWTYFDDEVIDGPGDSRILGVDDPRSSGLGNWRDEKGLSFKEVADRLADAACAADEDGDRVNTLLVHDANLGRPALERGCVDLVLGGHVHVQTGPTAVTAEDGRVGYTYTLGTTGGAAYAIAIGSKLRRPASIGLITYRDGRPVGIQSITLQTNGRYDVDPWVELTY